MKQYVQDVDVDQLVPHHMNELIYGNSLPSDQFVESIKEVGVLTPITLAADGLTIVSGRRRVAACVIIGKARIPAIVRDDLDDPVEIALEVLESNEHHDETMEQKTRRWAEVSALRYTKHAKSGGISSVAEIQRQAAKDVGASRTTMQRANKVLKAADRLRKEGMAGEAEQAVSVLNSTSVGGAEKIIKKALAKLDEQNGECPQGGDHQFDSDACVKCHEPAPPLPKVETVAAKIPGSALSADVKAKTPLPNLQKDKLPPKEEKRRVAREALDSVSVFRSIYGEMDNVVAMIRVLARQPHGVFIEANEDLIVAAISEARTALASCAPHCFCPSCEGIGCGVCGNRGWLTKMQHDAFVEYK